MVGTARTGERAGDPPELMIDLGAVRDDPVDVEPRRPFTWRRLRPVALGLVAALLLTTGGSGLPPEPILSEIASFPHPPARQQAAFPDRGMLLTEDRLFIAAPEQGDLIWRVSAYELDRGRRVWTYDLPVWPGTKLELQHRAGILLLTGPRPDRTGMRTVAVDDRTGRERWSLPNDVQSLGDDGTALAIDMVFPDDPALADSPEGRSSSYASPWGTFYGGPPLGRVVTGIDLGTGQVRWRSELLSSAVIDVRVLFSDGTLSRMPDRDYDLAVRTADGAAELRDPRTGAVRHRFPTVNPGALQLGGDLVLVRHNSLEVTAYSTQTYRQVWSRPVRDDTFLGFCSSDELICESGPQGAWTIDRADGKRLWPIPREHAIAEAGGHLIEFVPQGTMRPLRTVDPLTGAPRLHLMNWKRADVMASGRVLFVNPETFSGPTWLGVLRPGWVAPVALGMVPVGVSDCQLTAKVIACTTTDNALRIWRYRTPVQAEDE
ncbi:outer membrane protein assembly factor BamB family protein [Micromonospora sp. NBC_01796]|uniref:outer membrane protein assembly factor BamB family protein n=1 Tax=Micromonospora sp. NBC_01796 TaxID=2975987 RepID=UPI002DD99A9F|nr:PQQ-binding-like beta-propeller repeat protein [Micromonospora sp. NBC_01796]WSA87158.1 PQQ-like beta-propeller repeat protein [Micromonospora sp. NBC_01796]